MIEPAPNQRDLFEAALALAPEQRAAWLVEHCSDATQRGAIERMLAADAGAHMLDHSFDALLDDIGQAEVVAPTTGLRIGPFSLLEKLGEGGSSIVFRAEREQAGVKQAVALKLLRRGLYTADEQRRFRDERRALTQLRHPGIARLIEGGLTDTGMPYIALELVEGEPITAHARNRQLDLRQRLDLFVHVCRAVEAAHRALIVHRDLKPSNVFVTHDGDIKLLDFGIAKLLDADARGDDTRTLHVPLTPAYAAPEQFAGGQITTATDVYALGILLDEMITGQRREHGDSRTPSSRISENTARGELPASPKAVRRQLRGDLDNIVIKATTPEPDRRYASAGSFADDIERHLAGEPVGAHPPSPWYRARKFVGRHRGGVITSALFVLAIVAALAMAVWQAQVARREAHRANEQATRAERVKDTLVSLFSGLDPDVPPEKRPTLEQIFEKGIAELRADAAIEPALRVELLSIAGHVLHRLGQHQRGLDLAGEAVAVGETRLPPDAGPYLTAVATLSHLDFYEGRLDLAGARLGSVLDHAGGEANANSGQMDILIELASIARTRGDLKQAVVHLERANAMYDRLQPGQFDDRAFAIRGELAYTYAQMSRYEQALPMERALVDEAVRRYGREHETSARFMGDLGECLTKLGHWSEALGLLESSGDFLRKTLPAPNPSFSNWLFGIGWVFADQELWQPAERVFGDADAIMIARFGADFPLAFGPRAWLAESWTQQGRAEQARAELERMLALQLALKQPNARAIAMLRLPLGRALLKLDRPEPARAYAEQALATFRQLYGEENSRNIEPLALLARSLAATGAHDEAMTAAREAEKIAGASFARGNSARVRTALLLGDVQRKTPGEAGNHYRAAIDEAAAAPERPLALLIEAHQGLVDMASAAGNSAEAQREQAAVQGLRREFDAKARDAANQLDAWLTHGPAYK
ncbi:MAG: serine/threonine-protein kinase [Dokdonella sp.]